MNQSSKITLIISTVCVALLLVSQLIKYLETGEPGGIVSTICLVVGAVFMIISWIAYAIEQKRHK